MQENGGENGEYDDEGESMSSIPIEKHLVDHAPTEETINALGLMPVVPEFCSAPPTLIQPVITFPRSQVPRLKKVPLRKINKPVEPIPIAPVSKVNRIPNPPKLLPKPAEPPISTTPANHQQKLPKLKLSFKQPINNDSKQCEESDYEPPSKMQKNHISNSIEQPSVKPKSIKDFANNLKEIQKSFMQRFFEKQQELLSKDYEFQRNQDQKILKSFEEQNRILIAATKNLLQDATSNFYV